MDKHYGSIDGLRILAAIGIVMMHVSANTHYAVSGYVYNTIIPSFSNLVFLFFVISAFGMCVGYYEKILKNTINFPSFYSKRFKKIFPFFSILVLLDLFISPSLNSLYEGFADLTLLFGFLPNAGNITVIGVGWFIGVIFVFYICFPFYCCLIENKKRAWIVFLISLIYNFVCIQYFNVGRTNILFSSCYFIAGGLCYLYRHEIEKINSWIVVAFTLLSILSYYYFGSNTVCCLMVSSSVLIFAMKFSGGFLDNRVTKFLSGISMEIYLSHMFIFRIVEKAKLISIFGNGLPQYIVTTLIVLFGSIVFSFVMKQIIQRCFELTNKLSNQIKQ